MPRSSSLEYRPTNQEEDNRTGYQQAVDEKAEYKERHAFREIKIKWENMHGDLRDADRGTYAEFVRGSHTRHGEDFRASWVNEPESGSRDTFWKTHHQTTGGMSQDGKDGLAYTVADYMVKSPLQEGTSYAPEMKAERILNDRLGDREREALQYGGLTQPMGLCMKDNVAAAHGNLVYSLQNVDREKYDSALNHMADTEGYQENMKKEQTWPGLSWKESQEANLKCSCDFMLELGNRDLALLEKVDRMGAEDVYHSNFTREEAATLHKSFQKATEGMPRDGADHIARELSYMLSRESVQGALTVSSDEWKTMNQSHNFESEETRVHEQRLNQYCLNVTGSQMDTRAMIERSLFDPEGRNQLVNQVENNGAIRDMMEYASISGSIPEQFRTPVNLNNDDQTEKTEFTGDSGRIEKATADFASRFRNDFPDLASKTSRMYQDDASSCEQVAWLSQRRTGADNLEYAFRHCSDGMEPDEKASIAKGMAEQASYPVSRKADNFSYNAYYRPEHWNRDPESFTLMMNIAGDAESKNVEAAQDRLADHLVNGNNQGVYRELNNLKAIEERMDRIVTGEEGPSFVNHTSFQHESIVRERTKDVLVEFENHMKEKYPEVCQEQKSGEFRITFTEDPEKMTGISYTDLASNPQYQEDFRDFFKDQWAGDTRAAARMIAEFSPLDQDSTDIFKITDARDRSMAELLNKQPHDQDYYETHNLAAPYNNRRF